MPYPDAATAAANHALNAQLVPAPSEANVLFEDQALSVDRRVADFLAIAVACDAQVLNMQRVGHTKAAWRAALLQMLLGYYQWPVANQAGFYALLPQDPPPRGNNNPIPPRLADGSVNPAFLLNLGVPQGIIDDLRAPPPHQPPALAQVVVVDADGKKDIGITWLLSQTFFPDLKVGTLMSCYSI